MLDEKVIQLAQGPNFATVSTLLPDGTPMSQPHWVDVDADGEHLLINTETGRRKYRNIERDPRMTISIFSFENPYSYVEVRGKVVEQVTGPEARSHIDQLAQKYMGQDYPGKIATERVILKVAPDRTFIR